MYVGNDYTCPYYSNKSIVRCGKCGYITCNNGSKYFKCAYCSDSGKISGKITSAYVEQSFQNLKLKKWDII